ncbi:MAG: SPOR domain-containing protein [Prevotellaceae bacterium]|nr:SPOR domain-containing protein [Prevotellaceae bacterium]
MKNNSLIAMTLGMAVLATGCKSQESAYKAAYEKAQAQQTAVAQTTETTTVTVPQPQPAPQETQQQQTAGQAVVDADVRTIQGGFSVINGSPLKTYSVVVGSFVTQANAEGLMTTLRGKGYDSRVVKTNETINGQTGWFRVVASSYDDKASALSSRDELRSTYAGAWLLYSK